jgi:hypothetical protein
MTLTAAAGGAAASTSPKRAAARLVARLRDASIHAHADTFAASSVVARNRQLWLAVSSTSYRGEVETTHARVYRWSGSTWKLDGAVTADLGPSQWIKAVLLTGSRDPDFAIQGCGAGDTNCLGIVSDIGGRWHAVRFEYGYGAATEVNGLPVGHHLVQTEVDACGCAGGPSTWTYERYRSGMFRTVDPPGYVTRCSASSLTRVADPSSIQVLRFEHVACAHGWALAVGTGAGFTGRVVGLFDRGYRGSRWHLITLDNGAALPAAPAIYDLPLPLLERLARRLGQTLTRELAAAKLIARLESRYRFHWPQQNAIVRARGADWLVAVVRAGRAPNDYSPFPVAAAVYRWAGGRWAFRGGVQHLPNAMNLTWFGGWFVAVPAHAPPAVAFAVAGSDSNTRSVITNAGGAWHVARR